MNFETPLMFISKPYWKKIELNFKVCLLNLSLYDKFKVCWLFEENTLTQFENVKTYLNSSNSKMETQNTIFLKFATHLKSNINTFFMKHFRSTYIWWIIFCINQSRFLVLFLNETKTMNDLKYATLLSNSPIKTHWSHSNNMRMFLIHDTFLTPCTPRVTFLK